MSGKIQNEDIKSESELVSAGGSANQLPNADKVWIVSLSKTFAQAIADGDFSVGGGVPSGSILPFGGTSAPTGYLLCDGTSYLRTAQSALFSAIGTAYGAADGTHFNVPDLRGMFLRGVTGGTGNDPDAASRTALNAGGNTGNNIGSKQSDQFKSHKHDGVFSTDFPGGIGFPGTNEGLHSANFGTSVSGNSALVRTTNTGGNETRPTNVYVNYIIKT